ncbi:ethylene-responsive transcription factor ERF017-like [Tripterygium wilfordii]|uniref:ethylene-responsive transcription factor ERF017-like n=1 Tax=Tripterygium wilfordii TaxID=458696 RepID=UPI0018F84C25|nr:ethylene-responsive transcription factor ERF017-like [Tripterygium wilfordii]
MEKRSNTTTGHKSGDQRSSSSSDIEFKGVRKRKWGKWVSEIRLPNSRERIWLGSYDSSEKAARAFDAALFCLRGRSAKFNFPDNPPDIPGGRSMSPSEIQLAAARFANAEPEQPRIESGHSMDRSASESQMECSPSPSVSDGAAQLDYEMNLDGSLPDLFTNLGSGNYVTDYGLYPGLDGFGDNIFAPPMPSLDYEDENLDQYSGQDSFLWNF